MGKETENGVDDLLQSLVELVAEQPEVVAVSLLGEDELMIVLDQVRIHHRVSVERRDVLGEGAEWTLQLQRYFVH